MLLCCGAGEVTKQTSLGMTTRSDGAFVKFMEVAWKGYEREFATRVVV